MRLFSHSRSPSLALILAAASWGIGTVVSTAAIAEFPPMTLLARSNPAGPRITR